MNNLQSLPEPEMVKRHAADLRRLCKQFDALNLLLDEAIASAEADIRRSQRNVSLRASIKTNPISEDI